MNEHRFSPEQNAEQKTELLVKRIESLEFYNAILSDKLARADRKIATLSATLRQARGQVAV